MAAPTGRTKTKSRSPRLAALDAHANALVAALGDEDADPSLRTRAADALAELLEPANDRDVRGLKLWLARAEPEVSVLLHTLASDMVALLPLVEACTRVVHHLAEAGADEERAAEQRRAQLTVAGFALPLVHHMGAGPAHGLRTLATRTLVLLCAASPARVLIATTPDALPTLAACVTLDDSAEAELPRHALRALHLLSLSPAAAIRMGADARVRARLLELAARPRVAHAARILAALALAHLQRAREARADEPTAALTRAAGPRAEAGAVAEAEAEAGDAALEVLAHSQLGAELPLALRAALRGEAYAGRRWRADELLHTVSVLAASGAGLRLLLARGGAAPGRADTGAFARRGAGAPRGGAARVSSRRASRHGRAHELLDLLCAALSASAPRAARSGAGALLSLAFAPDVRALMCVRGGAVEHALCAGMGARSHALREACALVCVALHALPPEAAAAVATRSPRAKRTSSPRRAPYNDGARAARRRALEAEAAAADVEAEGLARSSSADDGDGLADDELPTPHRAAASSSDDDDDAGLALGAPQLGARDAPPDELGAMARAVASRAIAVSRRSAAVARPRAASAGRRDPYTYARSRALSATTDRAAPLLFERGPYWRAHEEAWRTDPWGSGRSNDTPRARARSRLFPNSPPYSAPPSSALHAGGVPMPLPLAARRALGAHAEAEADQQPLLEISISLPDEISISLPDAARRFLRAARPAEARPCVYVCFAEAVDTELGRRVARAVRSAGLPVSELKCTAPAEPCSVGRCVRARMRGVDSLRRAPRPCRVGTRHICPRTRSPTPTPHHEILPAACAPQHARRTLARRRRACVRRLGAQGQCNRALRVRGGAGVRAFPGRPVCGAWLQPRRLAAPRARRRRAVAAAQRVRPERGCSGRASRRAARAARAA